MRSGKKFLKYKINKMLIKKISAALIIICNDIFAWILSYLVVIDSGVKIEDLKLMLIMWLIWLGVFKLSYVKGNLIWVSSCIVLWFSFNMFAWGATIVIGLTGIILDIYTKTVGRGFVFK